MAILKSILGKLFVNDKQVVVLDDTAENGGIDNVDYGIVSGSNANGEYTKFPDGTLMCWYEGNITSSVEQTWTFPVAFTDIPHVNIEKDGGGTATPHQTIIGGRTTTFVLYNAYSTDGITAVTTPVALFAVGRWK